MIGSSPLEEFAGAFFGPVNIALSILDKANVTAMTRHFQHEMGIRFRFPDRVTFRSQERVILRIDEKGWNLNVRDELLAARFGIIVLGVDKAVGRSSVSVIELPQRMNPFQLFRVDFLREHVAFDSDFVS